MTPRARGPNPESGYAMLFVFALAAAAAILLYRELPRVAFEAQREQEQVLVDRGEQYQRAIQLYARKFQQYPPTLQALENTNNVRFLRRRYKDPMTGEEEWRLVRGILQTGMLTDSKVQKPPQAGVPGAPGQSGDQKDNKDQPSADASASGSEEHTQTRANLRRRPSESGGESPLLMPGQPSDQPPSDPQQQQPPPNPDAQSAASGQNPPPPGQTSPQPGQQPAPGQPYPVSPGQPYSVGQSGPPPAPPPSSPGQPPATPGTPGPANNEAMQMINRILTTPRPGGLSGQPSGTTVTGGAVGIAGVATKYEGEGIKIYNERSKYQEWEFVYLKQKDRRLAGQATGGVSGVPAQPLKNQGQQSQQQPAAPAQPKP